MVAKRKNISIVGVAWAMLNDQGLPLHLWVEAFNTMFYLQNKSPHQILGMGTPKESFSGNKPDVAQLRIFGSSVYCHVIKDAWKTLYPTIELGIFLGYIDTPHNYQVYLPTRRMTVVHRDVRFDDEKSIQVSLQRNLEIHADEEILAPKVEEP